LSGPHDHSGGRPPGIEDLDPAGLLDALRGNEISRRQTDLDQLLMALHWCGLHPATADTGVAGWGHPALPGPLDADESLGGEGTPLVAAFTPEPFAAALGVSTCSGMALLADALDLRYRLPLVWARVRALEVPAWKARRVAQVTHGLPLAGAAYVDRRLAPRLHTASGRAIDAAVADASAKYAPEAHADAEESAKAAWDVRLFHPEPGEFAGTSELHAVGDTLDLTRFHDLVCDTAAGLAALGDTDPLGVRKAKALGVIADTQATLDLYTLTDDQETNSPRPRTKTRGGSGARLFLHRTLADLATYATDGTVSVGQVERLGPATIAKITEWLANPDGCTILPVLRMDRADAVDAHNPPDWMRELVMLRDPRCVFPRCTRSSRGCDLDHIIPFDEHGPPGQTHPGNLAPLCRRHHRAKTSSRWSYRRRPDGSYEWTGPPGRTPYLTAHPN
jgi:hypothetical protein